MIYFILKVFLQRRAMSFQKAGLKLMTEERYREAAAMFEAGYQYFSERRWADRYRAISMLDYNGMDWREIMLANMATNLALAGDRERAIGLYQQCLVLPCPIDLSPTAKSCCSPFFNPRRRSTAWQARRRRWW